MTNPLHVLRFDGIHPDTLGHYFSGLGLLAAVGKKWPDVRGCWRERRFVLLHESLTKTAVEEYLLDDWQPTPYERWWGDAQKADTKAKASSEVLRLRNRRSVQEVQVLEAHIVGLNRNQFNPIFVKGGVSGRREFPKVQACCSATVQLARGKARGKAKLPKYFEDFCKQFAKRSVPERARLARDWMAYSLSGIESTPLPPLRSAGTWFLFGNETANSGQKWTREDTTLSPWSFLLAIEGALLFTGYANRRLSARARPYAVFPFVSDPAQPTTAGEIGKSKGEFWAPLWDCPATIAELRCLLNRGLARIGDRSAHAPYEFAIAALAAGTDAGVSEFARFDLRQTTSTEVHEAVPRESVAVGGKGVQASKLLLELKNWLRGLERLDENRKGHYRGLRGSVEESIIRVGECPVDAERWRHLLLLLSRQQARVDRNKSFRETFQPLPRLDGDWFSWAWPDDHLPRPDEIALARAIASIGAGTSYPILLNIYGIELDRGVKPRFVQGDRPPRVVWNEGKPERVMGQVLQRRLIDAGKASGQGNAGDTLQPFGGPCRATMAMITRLLHGELKLELIAEWIPALSLINWQGTRPKVEQGSFPYTGETLLFALFRPIFHERPERVLGALPERSEFLSKPALARRILNLIQFGSWNEAIQTAQGFYRAAGRSVVDVPVDLPVNEHLSTWLSAALLVPLNDREIRKGLDRWLVPKKKNENKESPRGDS